MSRNCVEVWLAGVSAEFAPGSKFRPVSLHTPGLATGRAGQRPMFGEHRSLRAGMPGKACPGPSSEAGARSDEGPCPDARSGRPSTAVYLRSPPNHSGMCSGPSPVAFRKSRRNPGPALNVAYFCDGPLETAVGRGAACVIFVAWQGTTTRIAGLLREVVTQPGGKEGVRCTS